MFDFLKQLLNQVEKNKNCYFSWPRVLGMGCAALLGVPALSSSGRPMGTFVSPHPGSRVTCSSAEPGSFSLDLSLIMNWDRTSAPLAFALLRLALS